MIVASSGMKAGEPKTAVFEAFISFAVSQMAESTCGSKALTTEHPDRARARADVVAMTPAVRMRGTAAPGEGDRVLLRSEHYGTERFIGRRNDSARRAAV